MRLCLILSSSYKVCSRYSHLTMVIVVVVVIKIPVKWMKRQRLLRTKQILVLCLEYEREPALKPPRYFLVSKRREIVSSMRQTLWRLKKCTLLNGWSLLIWKYSRICFLLSRIGTKYYNANKPNLKNMKMRAAVMGSALFLTWVKFKIQRLQSKNIKRKYCN